jgi:transposase
LTLSNDCAVLPGIFEFTLNELIDHHLDLSCFDEFYNNDEAGPKAYSPQTMVKAVLYAYSKGILSSRKIEAACRSNVTFMALSGEARPDHATIASFISAKGRHVKEVFAQILSVCAQLDLIGMGRAALDGCKLLNRRLQQAEEAHRNVHGDAQPRERTTASGMSRATSPTTMAQS